MKNFKLIIAVLVISLSTSFSTFAGNSKTENINTKLQSELTDLLGEHSFEHITHEVKFRVSFIINNKDQIVVISLNSNTCPIIEGFVKSKLNYKKVDLKGVKIGEV